MNKVEQRAPGICHGSVVKAREAAALRPCGSMNPSLQWLQAHGGTFQVTELAVSLLGVMGSSALQRNGEFSSDPRRKRKPD